MKNTEKFSAMDRESGIQIQKAQRTPNELHPHHDTSQSNFPQSNKQFNTREKSLMTFGGSPVKRTTDISPKTLQVREWRDIIQVLK